MVADGHSTASHPPALKRQSWFYSGRSMHPTLTASDMLVVEPYHEEDVRCGDVVVFTSPDSAGEVVHRVITVKAGRVRTRGDNNYRPDSYFVCPEMIIGRVVTAIQGGKERRVFGGRVGRILGALMRVRLLASRWISTMLHGPYHWLARTRLFTHMVPRGLQPQVVSFNRPHGTEHQVFMGTRAVGKLPAGSTVWRIDRPFRLFIDESSLPR